MELAPQRPALLVVELTLAAGDERVDLRIDDAGVVRATGNGLAGVPELHGVVLGRIDRPASHAGVEVALADALEVGGLIDRSEHELRPDLRQALLEQAPEGLGRGVARRDQHLDLEGLAVLVDHAVSVAVVPAGGSEELAAPVEVELQPLHAVVVGGTEVA